MLPKGLPQIVYTARKTGFMAVNWFYRRKTSFTGVKKVLQV